MGHEKLSLNIVFRLKLIQVIDLIHNDDFLLRHNVSVPTDDFSDFSGNFPTFFYKISGRRPETGTLRLENLIGTWRKVYSTPMAKFLSRWSWCYSFNIANASDLVDFSK